MEKKLHAQTAAAFSDKIEAFDKDVQRLDEMLLRRREKYVFA